MSKSHWEVWHERTRNVLADFDTEAEAIAYLAERSDPDLKARYVIVDTALYDRLADDRRDAVLDALGRLIAHMHVPRSMGSVMVPKEYDEVRNLINDNGWSSAEEVTDRLRGALAAQPAALDVAWAEAEELVGPGRLMLWASFGHELAYVAKVKANGDPRWQVYCYGRTPEEALRSLINNPNIKELVAEASR